MTNYKQRLIHEAVKELEGEIPQLIAHVTDINSDWESKARGERFYLAYKGAIYPIRRPYSGTYTSYGYLTIWGQQKASQSSPIVRRQIIDEIKEHIKATLEHAEKDSADRRRLNNIYPGLER